MINKFEVPSIYLNTFIYVVGGFANNNYWSSSEGSASNVWFQNFGSGAQNLNAKLDANAVRAVRSF